MQGMTEAPGGATMDANCSVDRLGQRSRQVKLRYPTHACAWYTSSYRQRSTSAFAGYAPAVEMYAAGM